MAATDWNELYVREARTLGRIGQLLARAELPRVEVRLPRELAEAAAAAWEREGDESAGPLDETCEQRLARRRAAALSLIGLAIKERGRWNGDEMVVDLNPVFIGNAADAADDLAD